MECLPGIGNFLLRVKTWGKVGEKVLALDVANLGSIPGTSYSPLSLLIFTAEPGVNFEHSWVWPFSDKPETKNHEGKSFTQYSKVFSIAFHIAVNSKIR